MIVGYQIDAYFPEHKLAIDELGHTYRDIDKETTRENKIKEKLQCKFIRISPDKENYDIFAEIGKIHNYIVKSAKKDKLVSYIVKMVKDKKLTYSLVCKKHTKDYSRGIEVLKNKILRQKSLCSLCLRDKSTFLKQKHKKKGKLVL